MIAWFHMDREGEENLLIMRLQKVLNGTHHGEWQFGAVLHKLRFSKNHIALSAKRELKAFQ